ncbi:hypothetical protein PR048_008926 [Dryococelus australis]|uniref:Uncharacterized protein n=1 Tax=Dryococelus australis TaxID=614101 RepID=A0ABQ9HYH0_9NEOP|nr:hypothetical protein PR048_008926 [Dryococelus australis]
MIFVIAMFSFTSAPRDFRLSKRLHQLPSCAYEFAATANCTMEQAGNLLLLVPQLVDMHSGDVQENWKLFKFQFENYSIATGLYEKRGNYQSGQFVINHRAGRWVFDTAHQESGESVEQFICRARAPSATYEYGVVAMEMVRDNIVVGMADPTRSYKLPVATNGNAPHNRRNGELGNRQT